MAGDCIDEELGLALVEQRVGDDERRAVMRHVGRCDDCRRLLAAMVRAIPTASHSGDDDAVELVEIGTSLGPYVVEGWLGRGGVGVVYVGRDARLDRKVALKLLARTDPDAAATRRFVREARILARLSDPHIVGVHDVGPSPRGFWIAMELVDGVTLDAWIRERERSRAEVLALFRQAAAGLVAAHAAGIVHRDFKPHNVMVGRDGRVRVLDFGLAAAIEAASEPDEAASNERTGVVGTPTYMAPEQFAGVPADARSDQFSFCIALWEALVGARPFVANTFASLAVEVAQGRIVDPGRKLPARIEAVLRRGLSVDPDARFESVAELVAALDRAERPVLRRVALPIAAAFGLGALAFAAIERPQEPCERGARAVVDGVREQIAALPAVVGDPLRDRTDAWASAYVSACISDRAQPGTESAAKLACLADRRAEIEALASSLEPERRPERVLSSLHALGICDDPQEAAESGLPADPELARRVQALRQRMAGGSARTAVRLDHGFRARYAAFVEEADAIGWIPLRAHAREEFGGVLSHHGAHEESVPMLESAYFLAKENGVTTVEFDAAVMLVSALGNHLGRHELALQWARHAEAALEELDDRGRASLFAKLRGELYQQMHRLDEAEADLRRGIELLPADATAFERATALSMLGNLYAEQWRCDQAEPLYREAVELGAPAFAELQALNGLAVCAIQAERPSDAIALFERGLALIESSNEPPDVAAQLISNLALLHTEAGELDLAITKLEEARGLSLDAFGPLSEEVRIVDFNLGRTYLIRGDHDRAGWWAQRVLEATPGQPPSIKMELQGTWLLKEAHRRAGRMREAIAAWEQRLALAEREGDLAPWADDLDEFAELLDEAGRTLDARAARQRATELRARIPESNAPA